jgi:hypothetical protein
MAAPHSAHSLELSGPPPVASGDPRAMSQREAGPSAQDKYTSLTRAWRKRKKKFLLALTAICASVFVLSVIGSHLWPSQAFTFGLWAGASTSFWLMARASALA